MANLGVVRTVVVNQGAETAAVVAAPGPGYRIVVTGYLLTFSAGTGTCTWQDSDTTPLSGALQRAALSAEYVGTRDAPALVLDPNKGLSLNNSAGDVDGHVTYLVVPA